MERELRSVVWDKWMGSDIDSVTLSFDQNSNGLVDEFDVPEDEQHMVLYAEDETKDGWDWVMIINPQDVAKRENATLPDIKIKIDNNLYSLQEVVKMCVEQKN